MSNPEPSQPPPAVLWPDAPVVADIAEVAQAQPLVHCITNVVAAGVTANALLAIGASPAMVESTPEAAEFVAVADSVLINLGTLSTERSEAMRAAAQAADRGGTPWVLDPVAVGVLGERTALAHELLQWRPTVIRGNAAEIISLAGLTTSGGRGSKGVDSLADSAEALDAAHILARRHGSVVAVSGVEDYLTDGHSTVRVPGGDVMLTRVTGTGCILGALIAAVTAVHPQPLRAATSASALLAAAGERATRGVSGPGSFAVSLLDELFTLSTSTRKL